MVRKALNLYWLNIRAQLEMAIIQYTVLTHRLSTIVLIQLETNEAVASNVFTREFSNLKYVCKNKVIL